MIKYKKNLCRIIILILIFVFFYNGNVFGMRKTGLDTFLRSFTYGGDTHQHLEDIVTTLQTVFGYDEAEVKDKMVFDTTIKIEKVSRKLYTYLPWFENSYNYTIKIR